MADELATTPCQSKRKRGRPTREEAAAALAGIDLTTIDPVAILRSIAADVSAPSSSRVAACKELLKDARERDGGEARHDVVLAKRTLSLLRRAN